VSIVAALITVLAFAGCKKQEQAIPSETVTASEPVQEELPPPPTSMPEATAPTAPATISNVELGTTVDADQRIAAPTTVFRPNETIIAAVSFKTSDASANVLGKVDVKWLSADKAVLKQESRDVELAGKTVATFRLEQPGGFAPGIYEVDVTLDGQDPVVREFEIPAMQ
jgi:hypothetical protein